MSTADRNRELARATGQHPAMEPDHARQATVGQLIACSAPGAPA